MNENKLTNQDLLVLTLMTNYLFVDDFKEALEYASTLLNKQVSLADIYERKAQAELKSYLWDDFVKLKKKLKELAQ